MLSLMMPGSILTRARGCAALWHAGHLPGPAYAGAERRDQIGNLHHAQLGSTSGADSNDPLTLALENGSYCYFPGSSGNSATLTLANSTTYDYTITYSDGTTAPGTQASSGAGLVTLGGTDVLFAGLKVARVVITADGGGATVADVDFRRRCNAQHTSLVTPQGQTVTINRSATGRKTEIVDRPMDLFGVDDYETTPDSDLFDPGLGSFSIAASFRHYGDPPDGTLSQIFSKKGTAATGSNGWDMGFGLVSGGAYTARVTAGGVTAIPLITRSAAYDGLDLTLIGVTDRGARVSRLFLFHKASLLATAEEVSNASVPSVANALTVRAGRYDNATPRYFEGAQFARAFFSKALTLSEAHEVARALNGGY